jgi:hypothetical protein
VEVSKGEVLAVLARVGRRDLLERAERELPDMFDLDAVDETFLLQLGLDRNQLIDAMAGSP